MVLKTSPHRIAGKREITWNFLKHRKYLQITHTLEDVKAAARAHEQDRLEHASTHNGATGKSEYLGNLVYGGLDGIITTFAVVSGVAGANLAPEVILILGLANLLADGFSMATGAYLSSKSEQEVYEREREDISEQIMRDPEGEKASLYEGYCKQGYPDYHARQLTKIISREPGRWVNTTMAEKLLLLPEKRKPLLEGLAVFVAFVVAGTVPLLVYLADMVFRFGVSLSTMFMYSLVLSGVALFALGAAKVYVTKRSALRSGLEMLLVGALAAAVAYGVGTFLKSLLPHSQ